MTTEKTLFYATMCGIVAVLLFALSLNVFDATTVRAVTIGLIIVLVFFSGVTNRMRPGLASAGHAVTAGALFGILGPPILGFVAGFFLAILFGYAFRAGKTNALLGVTAGCLVSAYAGWYESEISILEIVGYLVILFCFELVGRHYQEPS